MEVEFKTLRDNLENEILAQKTANLSLAEKLEETKMQQEKTKKIQKQNSELINKENASSIQKKVQQITTLSDKLAESMETIESKENELKITKDKLTNLDRIKSHDVEKYKTESELLKSENQRLKTSLQTSTKTLREELKSDREQMRRQCKTERENADKARNELIEVCKSLEISKNLLKNEKSERVVLDSEVKKLRDQIYQTNRVANDTKMAMYELAREQEKMQKEKVVKECLVWTSDEAVNNCSGCGDAFGVFNRKHHCRACGKIFCGGCTPHKLRIPGQVVKEAQRVCNGCAENSV